MRIPYPITRNEKKGNDLYLLRVERDGVIVIRQSIGYAEYYRVIYNIGINRYMRIDHGFVIFAPTPDVIDHGVKILDKPRHGISVHELRRYVREARPSDVFEHLRNLYALEPLKHVRYDMIT
ncbi:MAG: hypothetical protein GXO43_05935 [Crenarchaeota archaeon]|nr:hypothetical protein [Thermoproteota archaeon]